MTGRIKHLDTLVGPVEQQFTDTFIKGKQLIDIFLKSNDQEKSIILNVFKGYYRFESILSKYDISNGDNIKLYSDWLCCFAVRFWYDREHYNTTPWEVN